MKKNINVRRKKVVENLEKVMNNAKHVPHRFRDTPEHYGVAERKTYNESLAKQIAVLKDRIDRGAYY